MKAPMLTQPIITSLEKQQYRVIGRHSAVKICGWTKKSILGKGACYKQQFYGIKSHKCMQVTTSMSCANRCVFCWRDYKAPVSRTWDWLVDNPENILDKCIEQHKRLLVGFWGNKNANKELLEESKDVKHVAISLSGEPLIYPKINEFIRLCHKRGLSTFLVTNGQYPEELKKLSKVTQLYLSVDASNKKQMKNIDKPLFTDYWQRLIKSLSYFSKRKDRTCLRLTMINGMNMEDSDLNGYKELIELGEPDFIEIKAYMFVGASRQRLSLKNMPRHPEIKCFSDKLEKLLADYSYCDEHKASRVVLLARGGMDKKRFIDFITRSQPLAQE